MGNGGIMKTAEQFRQEETKRLLEWIMQNQGDWRQICDASGEGVRPEACERLIKELLEESFYEIILVLLTNSNIDYHMADITNRAVLNRILETWDKNMISTMTGYIINALSEIRNIKSDNEEE